MSRVSLFLLVMTSFSTLLLAKPSAYSAQSAASAQQYAECVDRAGLYQWDQAMCAADELERQAVILNKAVRFLMDVLDKDQRQRLESSQRKWAARADLKCDVQKLAMQPARGAVEIEEYKFCLSEENIHRIRWLERNYKFD